MENKKKNSSSTRLVLSHIILVTSKFTLNFTIISKLLYLCKIQKNYFFFMIILNLQPFHPQIVIDVKPKSKIVSTFFLLIGSLFVKVREFHEFRYRKVSIYFMFDVCFHVLL